MRDLIGGVVTSANAALRPRVTPELNGIATISVRWSGALIGVGESSAMMTRPAKTRRTERTMRPAVAGRRKVFATTVSWSSSQAASGSVPRPRRPSKSPTKRS